MSLENVSTEDLQKEVRNREAKELLGEFKNALANTEDVAEAMNLSYNFAQKVRKRIKD